ncbi:protocadherin gamma-A4-like [Scleropages formosus]|uniref:protocadherin gamma-A4-like n=1 Tax=Scleropages formosus TaxID=113540 RepID=UPI0010FA742E|nr:protocadherin gamma-A4-like [Scleropages formosus]
MEDTVLELIAVAEDRGQPSKSSTATVVVALRTISLTPSITFERPVYNFSVAENKPEGTVVGRVIAVTGESSVQVNYTLLSHTDFFSVDNQGRISVLQILDKEMQEWYTIAVEAVDSRIPPITAIAMVTVQVEDVNEAPVFNKTSYSAKIFSIAPYKHPVVQVKATDPDAGDVGELEYSLEEDSSLFDVEPSTGQVYVVSVLGQGGQVTLHLMAADPQGLTATTKVEVTVLPSSSSDVMTISVNHPASSVEKKVPQVEEALGKALGMTVTVISIAAVHNVQGRSPRSEEKTYISFIALDSNQAIVPSEQVRSKLESENEEVTAQLEIVFGSGLELLTPTKRWSSL